MRRVCHECPPRCDLRERNISPRMSRDACFSSYSRCAICPIGELAIGERAKSANVILNVSRKSCRILTDPYEYSIRGIGVTDRRGDDGVFSPSFFSLPRRRRSSPDSAGAIRNQSEISRRPAVRNARRMKTSAGQPGVSWDYNAAPVRCRFARTSHSARRTMTNNECALRTSGDFVRIRARFRPARTSSKKDEEKEEKKPKKKEKKRNGEKEKASFSRVLPLYERSVARIDRAIAVLYRPRVREKPRRRARNYLGWKRKLRIGRLLNAQMDAKLGPRRTGGRASRRRLVGWLAGWLTGWQAQAGEQARLRTPADYSV